MRWITRRPRPDKLSSQYTQWRPAQLARYSSNLPSSASKSADFGDGSKKCLAIKNPSRFMAAREASRRGQRIATVSGWLHNLVHASAASSPCALATSSGKSISVQGKPVMSSKPIRSAVSTLHDHVANGLLILPWRVGRQRIYSSTRSANVRRLLRHQTGKIPPTRHANHGTRSAACGSPRYGRSATHILTGSSPGSISRSSSRQLGCALRQQTRHQPVIIEHIRVHQDDGGMPLRNTSRATHRETTLPSRKSGLTSSVVGHGSPNARSPARICSAPKSRDERDIGNTGARKDL